MRMGPRLAAGLGLLLCAGAGRATGPVPYRRMTASPASG